MNLIKKLSRIRRHYIRRTIANSKKKKASRARGSESTLVPNFLFFIVLLFFFLAGFFPYFSRQTPHGRTNRCREATWWERDGPSTEMDGQQSCGSTRGGGFHLIPSAIPQPHNLGLAASPLEILFTRMPSYGRSAAPLEHGRRASVFFERPQLSPHTQPMYRIQRANASGINRVDFQMGCLISAPLWRCCNKKKIPLANNIIPDFWIPYHISFNRSLV